MKFNNEKSYIIIPNVAFGFETKYHLTSDELMLYAYLQLAKSIGLENRLVTMIDVIAQSLEWKKSNIDRLRNRVVDALEGLQNKEYITIEFSGKDIKKSVLTITINKNMEHVEAESVVDWRENPFIWKGFTRVECSEFNLSNGNGQHLTVIAYTKWRDNAKFDYKISYQEWQAVINVSDNTARRIIKDCEPFINKVSGSYYKDEKGQFKQEANTYSIKDKKADVKESEKQAKAVTAHEKFAEKVTDVRYKFDDNILRQINDFGTKWSEDGYKAWLETDCQVLKEAGENKFKMLERAGQGWVREKLENEINNERSQENKSRELHSLADNHLADFNNEIDFDNIEITSEVDDWTKEWAKAN